MELEQYNWARNTWNWGKGNLIGKETHELGEWKFNLKEAHGIGEYET